MENRVPVFVSQKGPLTEVVLEGIYSANKSLQERFDFYEFEGGRRYEETLSDLLEKVSIEDCDAVITIGAAATRLAVEAFSKRRFPVSIVCCAVSDTFLNNLKHHAPYLTGVAMKMASEYLPMQAMLRINPGIKRFLLPYRENAKNKRMSFEADRIYEYFNSRKIEVVKLAIASELSQESIEQSIADVDAVIVPEGGLTSADICLLKKTANQMEKFFFGDSQTVQQAGGIYALREDVLFAGTKVCEYINEVVYNGKAPADLPPYIIESSRQLTINPDEMAKSGVFIADDVLVSMEGTVGTFDLPTYTICANIHTETTLFYSLRIASGQQVQKENDACYRLCFYVGWPTNPKFTKDQAELIVSQEFEYHLYFDDAQAHATWQAAQQAGVALAPMLVVSVEDQLVDNGAWHKRAREQGVKLTHIKLPALDTLMPLEMVASCKKDVKTIGLVIKFALDNLPDWVQKRVDAVQAACDERGLTLKLYGGTSYHDARKAVDAAMQETEAIIYWPDAMCVYASSYLAYHAYERNIPTCAGGLLFGQIAPLCYGYDLQVLRKIVVDAMCNFLHRKANDGNVDLALDPDTIISFCVNQALSDKMGLSLPGIANKLAYYGGTPLDQERNFAACLDALPPSKDHNIRIEAARKSLQANLQAILEREEKGYRDGR